MAEEGERGRHVPEREKLPIACVGHPLVCERRLGMRQPSVDAVDTDKPIDEECVM